jgi:hypothetical protein
VLRWPCDGRTRPKTDEQAGTAASMVNTNGSRVPPEQPGPGPFAARVVSSLPSSPSGTSPPRSRMGTTAAPASGRKIVDPSWARWSRSHSSHHPPGGRSRAVDVESSGRRSGSAKWPEGGADPGAAGLGKGWATPTRSCGLAVQVVPWSVAARSRAMAPALSRGSFQLPHLGDCTHEGQPSAQPQPSSTSRVAASWRWAAA